MSCYFCKYEMKRLQPMLKSDETISAQSPSALAMQTQKRAFIPVLRPIEEVTTFESVDDFTNYYQQHKEELDALSTCKLNKMFKIIVDDEPLKITKIKGELTLRTIPKSRITALMRIEELEEQQNEIIEKINAIIALITQ